MPHALHIPEITLMIVSHLTPGEILVCRGVSHEWRQVFSPFLQLHAIYCNRGAAFKAMFEARLETLGRFVQSLKQVYPSQPELERIQRTCSELRHIGFIIKRKDMLNTRALVEFFEAMSTLERIEVFSFHDQSAMTFLFCLASYGLEVPPSASATTNKDSGLNSAALTAAGGSSSLLSKADTALRELEIGCAVHSLKPSCLNWTYLEAVLKRHPLVQKLRLRHVTLLEELDLKDAEGLGWARSLISKTFLGPQVQQKWTALVGRMATGTGHQEQKRVLNKLMPSLLFVSTTCLGTTTSAMFNHVDTLVLDGVQLSEELFESILRRCPVLATLDLRLVGLDLPMSVWPHCLSHCPRLANVMIRNDFGGIHLDIAQFWTLVPSTLISFHASSNHDGIIFAEPGFDLSLQSAAITDRRPGSALTSLDLSIGISIADSGVRYVMQYCGSLETLTLEFLYFKEDWGNVGESITFPVWACGTTLKRLELRARYRPFDQELDERALGFVRRLQDLKVLQMLVLPAKMLSDLSESQHEDYAAFRDVLDMLELQELLRDQAQAQQASSQTSLTLPGSSIFALNEEQQSLPQQQGHVWDRDALGPRNFVPPMPSVREVKLTAASGVRLSMQMRYLHILMEAMPGIKTIWTAMALYELDRISRFNAIHKRFQELYGNANVQLNLGDS
ncbi:hypothetical protein BGZ54_000646 [Gamsiella multidivaricata]|nr:hypothetical protein BGZ54_000646 [Gamsiella multidivaricata]